MRGTVAPTRIVFVCFLLAFTCCSHASAQEESPSCCARFEYVLERTIFKIDAVRLELTLHGTTPGQVVAFVRNRPDPKSSSDSVASLYLAADDADVRMTFLRSFSLGRFLDGNRDIMEKLRKAGILSDEEVRIGPEQRRVLMGSLFGPRSGFRRGLLDLVFRGAEAEGGRE